MWLYAETPDGNFIFHFGMLTAAWRSGWLVGV